MVIPEECQTKSFAFPYTILYNFCVLSIADGTVRKGCTMILVIDAGNTNITMGAYENNHLVFVSRLATDRYATSDRIAIDIYSILQIKHIADKKFEGAAISSVVPEITNALESAVRKITGKKPVVIGPGVKTGLNIRVDNPAGLGADLVATAVAAKAQYKLPCLILDLGTATKVSALDENGAFLGCAISPGVALSLAALAREASQLSTISLKAPDHAIGTNDDDSMNAGSIFGTVDMLDGMCDRFSKELKVPVQTIVATGGLCSITENCKHEVVENKDLVLQGLKIIYDKNS